MVTLSSSRSFRRAHVPRVGQTFWAAIRGLIAAIARELEVRRSMDQLASWDDYMLRDIGLTRGDIERMVRFGRM